MKATILAIVFSMLLMDFSLTVNAQQVNNSLSAMKDSFPAFVSTSEDEILLGTAPECPTVNFDLTRRDFPCEALGIIYMMTQQERANLELHRVRVVNSDEQNTHSKKKTGGTSKKQKAQL
ncbi:MAG TPA: hypothetical protein VE978_09865 [Chitinophagales bacterium]|nr:hypothetical protein [Chitinophagales bacterium]